MVTVQLTLGEFDALVYFDFNLRWGLGASTLLKLLNADDFAGAADQFNRWDRDYLELLARGCRGG